MAQPASTRLKVAMIVPAIGNDARVMTPVVNTFVDHLGYELELHVFPLYYPSGSEVSELGAATVHPVDAPDLRLRRLVPRTLARLRREHRIRRFDAVHGLWLFPPGAVAVLAGHLLRVPSIVSIGGGEVVAIPDIQFGGLLSQRGRVIQRQVLARASLVTGGSGYVLDLARSLVYRPAGYDLAPLPVDERFLTPVRRTLLADPERPRLLHAASLIPVKDQETLLRAFVRLREARPGASLEIAGEDPFGHRAELERVSARLGVTGAVHFLGPVPHAEMASLYQRADLFLLSSRHESQAMVVLEAAASGVPTVGTAVGVVRDLAPKSASAVPVHDPDALAAAALNLLGAPERLRQMGAFAQAQVVRRYGGTALADRFLHLYRTAIERHNA